ncbi:MAG: hypothetical protein KGJ43_07535, partial [Acidobacteriota bacterium]|nr:hypothetical protein [Acidobacteriota bacterium]
LRVSIEALAVRLETSLPGRARVERSGGGLFGRGERRVREITVVLSSSSYQLAVDGTRMEGARERRVGGIAIKREPLDPQAWLAALTEELQEEAQRSASARESLQRLLG